MKHKLCYVRWLDACYLGTDWKTVDELRSDGDAFEVESAGFLVSEDGRGIYLGTDYDPEGKRWRHMSFIPHGMIVKRKTYRHG